jgi:hypothetical protein
MNQKNMKILSEPNKQEYLISENESKEHEDFV